MLNVLFVILGVHIALVLAVTLYVIPNAIKQRSGFVDVAKGLGLVALAPYLPALLILAYELDRWDKKRT